MIMNDESIQLPKSDDVFELKFLDPQKVRFFREGDALRVTIEDDKSCLRVVPMRSFPISMRDRYISLRDMDGNELGMIRDMHELDKKSRKLLEQEIRRRYFTPEIRRIIALREKFGIVEWEVDTDRGPKSFFTRSLHQSVNETTTGYIVTDMENNRYEIRDLSSFDPQSAAILARKI